MITVRILGSTPYVDTLERMRDHVAGRVANRDAAGDEIWITEHPPVFTLGFASRREHLLDTGDIAVVVTERGGQVTYHGPGQVVAYLLLDLRRRRLGVRDLVGRLEEGIIRCLALYRVVGVRRPGAPGIFVQSRPAATAAAAGTVTTAPTAPTAKIASIGLKVSRGLTWHGVALNGRMDLRPFTRIDPCGYPGLTMTDLASEAAAEFEVEPADLASRLAASLAEAIEG